MMLVSQMQIIPVVLRKYKCPSCSEEFKWHIKRINIRNIIMQGTVWANLCCTVLMDKLGKIMYEKLDLMYKYKRAIPVPSLQMVDDVMVLGRCSSSQTVQSNSVVNSFMNTKKLTLSETKCHTVHIGNSKLTRCSSLKVQDEPRNKETSVKYLGDHVNHTGSVKATVEERRARAFGILQKSSQLLIVCL